MRIFSVLILVIFLSACSTKQPNLNGFDLDKWKSDRKGCQGTRLAMKEALFNLKPELKGVSQNDFFKLFGRPDGQILDERNRKIYIYYLEDGEQCKNDRLQSPSTAETVAIYFSAVSLVTEVTFQKGNP